MPMSAQTNSQPPGPEPWKGIFRTSSVVDVNSVTALSCAASAEHGRPCKQVRVPENKAIIHLYK